MSTRRMMVLADGASIHTVKWIEGLSLSSDWELYLITMNPAPFHPELKNIRQLKEMHQFSPERIYASGNNFHYIFQVPKILKLRNRIRPHLINTVYLTSYGVVGALIRGESKLCHFTIGTDVMLTPDRNVVFDRLTQFALNRADFIVSVSQTMTDKLISRFHVPPERILTQSYGISDWVLGYAPRRKIYDFVSGRMWVANSNIDFILDLVRHLPQCRMALVGDAVRGEEALAEKILRAAQELPSVNRFGVLPYEKNIEVMAESEFFFSLTSSDGASSSLMEAMALGAIPLVSDTAPNREWVRQGENGFLLPLGNQTESLRLLNRALSLPSSAREEMRKLNQEIIQNRASFQKNMRLVLQRMEWPTNSPVSP